MQVLQSDPLPLTNGYAKRSNAAQEGQRQALIKETIHVAAKHDLLLCLKPARFSRVQLPPRGMTVGILTYKISRVVAHKLGIFTRYLFVTFVLISCFIHLFMRLCIRDVRAKLLLCCCLTSTVNNYGHGGRSVNLTTLFLDRPIPTKRLTSTQRSFFRHLSTTALLESAEGRE